MVNILMTRGEFAEAKRHLNDMVKLGDVQKNHYQDFIKFCDRNEELAVKIGHHLGRGIAYANNKWFDRVLNEYGEIMKIVPSNTSVYHLMADILIMTGGGEKAIEICKKTIELDPKSPHAYNKLASIYNRNAKMDEAETLYRKVISIAPDNTTAHLNLGLIQESKDLTKESIEAYEKAIELDPSSPIAYNNLAWLYASRMQDKLDYALKLAGKAKELAPENPAVIDTHGWMYYLSGMHEEAFSELKAAVAGAPQNPTIRYHLGMSYYKKGLQVLALNEMEHALRLSSTFPEAKEASDLIEKIRFYKENRILGF
jgi:tetratricopeptide (TPR) repeat protein